MSIKNSILSICIICNFLLVQNLYGDDSYNLIKNDVVLMNCENIDDEEECVLSECTWDPDRGCYSTDYDECNEYSQNLCEAYESCQWDENLNVCIRIDSSDENDIEDCSEVDNQEECIRIPGCDWSTVATPNGVFDMCVETDSDEDGGWNDDGGWDECSQLSQDECTVAEYCEWDEETQECTRFEGEEDCDPNAICGQVVTCVDGLLYSTTCGPENCDDPIGECDDNGDGGDDCDSDLSCGEAITCIDGLLYPTTCGPENCDEPIGECDDNGDGGEDGPPECLLDCEGVEDINSDENPDAACDWIISNFGPNNFFNECAQDCDEETLREISEYASLCYECLQSTNIDCSSVFDNNNDCSNLSYDECIQSDNCEPSLNSAGQFEGCIEGNGLDGGCYDSSGQFYSLGEVFFISECDYYICNENGFEGPFTQDECGEDDGGGCEDGGGMIAYLELENVVGYLNQEVLVPIYLKSPEPVGGVQFKLFNSPGAVPSGINSLDDCFTAEYNSLEEAYIGIIFSLEGCSYPANEQVHIADLAFEISPFVPIGVDLDLDFDYTIVSDSEGNEIESCGIGSSIQTGMLGDVNSDGEINVLDIVSMVNFALGSDYPNDIEFWASDINGDGSINVLDIVSIVNIILAD